MKIGVFGDSFANREFLINTDAIFYNFLQHRHGHQVDCFGESGSSILFSAGLIEKKQKDYDIVIWCLTTPGRFSIPQTSNKRTVHVNSAYAECPTTDVEITKKFAVCQDYLKYIFDWDTENFVGKAIVSYLQSLYSNIMIIPCFRAPLDVEFNLYELCEREIRHYFPDQSVTTIYKDYQDMRAGHLSQENQKILAELINQNLRPGIFQTSYDNFINPTQPFTDLFEKYDSIR